MFFSSFYSPYLQQNVGYLVTLSNTPGRNFSVIHYNWMLGSISYFFFWWHQMALITLTSLTFNSLQSLMIISMHWMLAATVKTEHLLLSFLNRALSLISSNSLRNLGNLSWCLCNSFTEKMPEAGLDPPFADGDDNVLRL